MKVLLVSANTETINMPVLPLGLSCIARATREAGYAVELVNTLDREQLIPAVTRAVDEFAPDVVGISVRNIDDQVMEPARFLLEPVRDLVSAVRGRTRAPIVLGGAGFSIFPEAALSYLGADMGIRGPGEKAFLTLLDCLEQNRDPSDIPGLYLPGKTPLSPRNATGDINDYPIPRPEDQLFAPGEAGEDFWVPFQTRRGCPMDCSYCSTSAIEGRITRKRHLDHVLDMLSAYNRAGYSRFFFVDNTFNLPPAYAKALCDGIVDKGPDLSWRCIIYPRNVDEELAEKMAAAGCVEVSLGFESGSPEMLRALNKKFTPEDVRTVSARLRKHNLRQTGFLLLGGPGENEKTLAESLGFAESLNLDAMKVTCGIRIYPGTRLARRAVADGVVAPDDDLLFPRYYLAPALKATLKDTVAGWLEKHPNWFS